jgi:hypothetical protein
VELRGLWEQHGPAGGSDSGVVANRRGCALTAGWVTEMPNEGEESAARS